MRIVSGLAVSAVVLLAATAAQATVIYQTDFEAPDYAIGALGGQNGWQTFGSGAAVTVDGAAPIGGAQSAKITGALALGQSGPFHTDPSAIPLVTLSADILLTSSGANDRSWQFAAIGPGLLGFTGGIDIDAGTGAIRAITSGFPSIGTFTRGQVHRVDILLNYTAQTYGVRLDGGVLATGIAFCGDNGGCAGAPTAGYTNLIFDTFGATGGDAGYLDNILVQTTVPEPLTWSLMLLGFGLAGATLRRRSLSIA